MKILAGTLKNRNFYMPADLRPTQNVVRAAVFGLLGQDFEGVHFLDLFAGSGAVGLEAASRGAYSICFVERNSDFCNIIDENMEILNLKDRKTPPFCDVMTMDSFAAIKTLAGDKRQFDVIFADPPYGQELGKKALKTLSAYDILTPNCHVIIEMQRGEFLPESCGKLTRIKYRQYGRSILTVYEAVC